MVATGPAGLVTSRVVVGGACLGTFSVKSKAESLMSTMADERKRQSSGWPRIDPNIFPLSSLLSNPAFASSAAVGVRWIRAVSQKFNQASSPISELSTTLKLWLTPRDAAARTSSLGGAAFQRHRRLRRPACLRRPAFPRLFHPPPGGTRPPSPPRRSTAGSSTRAILCCPTRVSFCRVRRCPRGGR